MIVEEDGEETVLFEQVKDVSKFKKFSELSVKTNC